MVMVGTYLAGLALIGAALGVWQRVMHLPTPEAFHGYSGSVLAVLVVMVAPIGEEILFRGWLTGRTRALWLLAMAVVAAAMLALVAHHRFEVAASLAFGAAWLAGAIGWFVLRAAAEPPRWFVRWFAWWLRGSVLVFALAHLSNYPQASLALLPMVLPQLWAGLVFAYLRMRFGLGAGILAHAIGNATALALALLAGG
jgi:membrane protease YdiL (CAAX protease family)